MLNKVGLVRDPLLLHLGDFVLELLCLLQDVVLLSFHWSRVLVDTSVLEECPLSVELIDLELLFVNPVVPLLDVLLELLYVDFFLFELGNQVFKLFLEQLVLLLAVEIVDPDSRYLIREVLNLDFLLGDVLIGNLGLLEQVSRALLDGLLL